MIDQAPEEALPRLAHTFATPAGVLRGRGMITFFPTEPGTTTPEPTNEAEKERRERLTAEVDLGRMSERVEQRVLRAVERLTSILFT